MSWNESVPQLVSMRSMVCGLGAILVMEHVHTQRAQALMAAVMAADRRRSAFGTAGGEKARDTPPYLHAVMKNWERRSYKPLGQYKKSWRCVLGFTLR